MIQLFGDNVGNFDGTLVHRRFRGCKDDAMNGGAD